LESFKECVRTHSPNLKVLKIDNAEINYLYSIFNAPFFFWRALKCKRVPSRRQSSGVSPGEAWEGTDLCDSSDYISENLII